MPSSTLLATPGSIPPETWVDGMTAPNAERFTRLTPVPDDVVIDRDQFTKTVHLLALRVPKVSTAVVD